MMECGYIECVRNKIHTYMNMSANIEYGKILI